VSLSVGSIVAASDNKNSKNENKEVALGLKELQALPRHRKIYYFGKIPHHFIVNQTSGVTISNKCDSVKIPDKCLASKKLIEANILLLDEKDRRGGKNPGSVMCKKLLKGKVRFGKDREGNTSTFCAFSDGSMVSSDTVTFWGNKNAKKKKQ